MKLFIKFVLVLSLLINVFVLNSGVATEVNAATSTDFGNYIQVSDLPEQLSFHGQSTLLDGKVLVTGGYNYNTVKTSQHSYIYDVNTDVWTQVADLPIPMQRHGQSVLPDGRVIVTGGVDGSVTAIKKVYIYDPVADQWTEVADMPAEKYFHGQSTLSDGRVLATAGNLPDKSTNMYNPTTNVWSEATQIPYPRYSHRQSTLLDGRVVVIGGTNASSRNENFVESYDPISDTWSTYDQYNNTELMRTWHAQSLLQDGRVFVTGGLNKAFLSSTFVYNITTNTIQKMADLPITLYAHNQSTLLDGNVLITGGYNNGSVESAYIFSLAPSIALIASPNPTTAAKGLTQSLTITAMHTDGSTQDVTALASYASGDSGIATVDASGLIKGVTQGNTNVSVSYEGQSITVQVTVTEPILTSLSATPNSVNVAKGLTQSLTVTAMYSDGSTQDVTALASYVSGDSGIATVDASGLIKGVTQGNTNVTVSHGEQSITVQVTVTAPILTSLSATPNSVNVAKGLTQSLTLTAIYSDGSTQDVTDLASYTSGDSGIATVDANGLIKAVTQGNTNVSVSYEEQIITVPVTITEPILTSLSATPNSVNVAKGLTQSLTVTAMYSDGSTQDVTDLASYVSGDSGIATVDASGLIKGMTQGNTNVAVSYRGQSIAVPVIVTDPVIVSMVCLPSSITIGKGLSAQLTVIGTYSDGSILDVTNKVSYASVNNSTADVNNLGLVIGNQIGSTTIVISKDGVTANIPVTIKVPIVSYKITPKKINLISGKTKQITVTAKYADGTSQDVTSLVVYTSQNQTIATIDNEGLITGVSKGLTSITLSFEGKTDIFDVDIKK